MCLPTTTGSEDNERAADGFARGAQIKVQGFCVVASQSLLYHITRYLYQPLHNGS